GRYRTHASQGHSDGRSHRRTVPGRAQPVSRNRAQGGAARVKPLVAAALSRDARTYSTRSTHIKRRANMRTSIARYVGDLRLGALLAPNRRKRVICAAARPELHTALRQFRCPDGALLLRISKLSPTCAEPGTSRALCLVAYRHAGTSHAASQEHCSIVRF